MSLAKGARHAGRHGSSRASPSPTSSRRAGRVTGVRTPYGDIEAEFVVNCAGMWARQLGAKAGVNIPLQAAEHYYLITEQIPGRPRGPGRCSRTRASYGYFREEGGGLMLGLFEPVCAPWNVGGIPDDFSFGELPPDWERMAPVPREGDGAGPDHDGGRHPEVLLRPGELHRPTCSRSSARRPSCKNYFVAAGLNSIGILTGGGLGRALAHWIVDGRARHRRHRLQHRPAAHLPGQPGVPRAPARSSRWAWSTSATTRRGRCRPPAARSVSPFHDRLVAQRAYFRDVSGWEGADWYAPGGVEPTVEQLSWGRQNWFPYWAAEHRAAREGVIVMDMSFMSKFLVRAATPGALLDRISANASTARPGVITYTQWLNEGGTLEADLTVTKLDDDRFWVVASDTAHRHAQTWMRRHFGDAHAFVTDVTSGYAQLNVQGPRSRELLPVADVGRPVERGVPVPRGPRDRHRLRPRAVHPHHLPRRARLRALHPDRAGDARLRPAGRGRARRVGLRHAGLKALASLRMEKGYRDYGHDIDNTDSVLEAGLGFAVALDKPGGFIGRDAVLAKKARGPADPAAAAGPGAATREPHAVPRRGGPPQRRAGRLRARRLLRAHARRRGRAGDGRGRRAARPGLDRRGRWEVEIAGERYPAIGVAPAALRPDQRAHQDVAPGPYAAVMAKPELYVATDVEADGPIPGPYSMISLGMSVAGQPELSFYTELRPISDEFVPEALAVSGLDRERLLREAPTAEQAMQAAAAWVDDLRAIGRPVFLAAPAVFDGMFVHWYFVRYTGRSPFGATGSGVDLRSYWMGQHGVEWSQTGKRTIVRELGLTGLPHTHHAGEDAAELALIFDRVRGRSQDAAT